MAANTNLPGVNVGETSADVLEKSIDVLNSYLRGEISAVETYEMALNTISEPSLRSTLSDCLQSHQERVTLLRQRVDQLGGRASEGSGLWGGFTKLIEGGAKVLGTRAALAALEEGEDYGLKMYRDKEDREKIDPESRRLTETRLLTAQEKTHAAMSRLKHSFH
jgi:demethoxyubiquinone hydroxylase (CLK1/Coq7/Cat5 family)